MKTETTVTTRPEAGKDGIDTKVVINWDGMTQEDLVALAQQQLVIKLQSGWRKNGIPAEANVNAADYKVGVRAPRVKKTLEELLAELSPEDRKALIEKYK